uniref:Uncharacterized protein n=1 Tax=Acartia pacifica TaxID=335913 RepID=A0A0U2KDA5_ACAPC|nr:hypothetical protein [Acartia pacifica]
MLMEYFLKLSKDLLVF